MILEHNGLRFTAHSKPLDWQNRGLQQTASGYGRKLTTSIVVRLEGEKKTRRVYCTCYSNSGSLWIVLNGRRTSIGELFADNLSPL